MAPKEWKSFKTAQFSRFSGSPTRGGLLPGTLLRPKGGTSVIRPCGAPGHGFFFQEAGVSKSKSMFPSSINLRRRSLAVSLCLLFQNARCNSREACNQIHVERFACAGAVEGGSMIRFHFYFKNQHCDPTQNMDHSHTFQAPSARSFRLCFNTFRLSKSLCYCFFFHPLFPFSPCSVH